MMMPDVNVLIYAHDRSVPRHAEARRWLEERANSARPFALSCLVAVGFVRIVTNPKACRVPRTTDQASKAIRAIADLPNCRIIYPSEGHLELALELCAATKATGKLVADAQHAAIAIAEGATWVTADADFRRFEAHGLDLDLDLLA